MTITRQVFLDELGKLFPDVASQIRHDEWGLLHLEVAAFRRATEQAMDRENFWAAEQHFRFVERMLRSCDPELRNALEVSYLVDLALGEHTAERHRAVRERMPLTLRDEMIAVSNFWQ